MRTLAAAACAVLLAGCGERLARYAGDPPLDDRELTEAARRPLTAWRERGRNPADLVDAAAAMHSRLDRAGYPLAVVEPDAVGDAEPLFRIDAGPRVAIGSVRVSGDTGASAGALVAAAALDGWFSSSALTAARRRIAAHLRATGHLGAEVRRGELTWSPQRDRVDIHFAIAAGPRYVLREQRLELAAGAPPGLAAELAGLLDRPGAALHPRLGAEAAARVRAALGERGHLAARVEIDERLDAASAGAVQVVRVAPGPVHTLADIAIAGGRRSRRSFVVRRLRELEPGQPLSQAALDRAESDLALTGLYRSVRIETAPAAPPAAATGTVPTDVRVALREADSHHLDWSIGYGSYEQLRGGVEYRDDHLFGAGLRLRAGAYASLVGWGGDLGIAEPFRFGPGRLVALDLTYEERAEPSFSHRETAITPSFTQRFRAIGDPVTWELRLAHRFEAAEDFDVGDEVAGRENATYTISKISAEVSRDARRPKRVDPDEGSFSVLGTAWSGEPVGAEIEYLELHAGHARAVTVAPWLVVALHVDGIVRQPLNGDELPLGERLFLGGEDTVRSFAKDDLTPRDAAGQPLGGLTSVVANVELRWRPFANRRALEIATFYDIGWLDLDAWSLTGPPGQAIGGGIRYRLPVGPIRVDAGWNPGDRLGAEDSWAIHAAVGFAF